MATSTASESERPVKGSTPEPADAIAPRTPPAGAGLPPEAVTPRTPPAAVLCGAEEAKPAEGVEPLARPVAVPEVAFEFELCDELLETELVVPELVPVVLPVVAAVSELHDVVE